MVHAATIGAIDFSKADLLSRLWWLKLRWVLDRIESEQVINVYRLQHAQHMAVLDYHLPQETFDLHWKGGNQTIQNIFALSLPWTKDKQSTSGSHKDLIEQWKTKFGDLSDPAVKAKFDKMAQILHEHNNRNRVMTAEKSKDSPQARLQRIMSGRRARKRR